MFLDELGVSEPLRKAETHHPRFRELAAKDLDVFVELGVVVM